MGLRFTAKGMGDMKGVRFGDINGDVSDHFNFTILEVNINRAVMTGCG
jgi:hypothetical protein